MGLQTLLDFLVYAVRFFSDFPCYIVQKSMFSMRFPFKELLDLLYGSSLLLVGYYVCFCFYFRFGGECLARRVACEKGVVLMPFSCRINGRESRRYKQDESDPMCPY